MRIADSGEVVLKSGKSLGHRSFSRYYKQRLRPVRKNQDNMVRVFSRYRQLTMEKYSVDGVTHNDRTSEFYQGQSKEYMKVGVKGASLVKHFRKQMMV